MIPKNVQMPNPNPKYKPPGTAGGGRGGNTMKYDNCKDCVARCVHAGKDREFICGNGVSCKVTKKPIATNADKIRAMSDEELAEELVIEIEGLFPSLVYVPMGTFIFRETRQKKKCWNIYSSRQRRNLDD